MAPENYGVQTAFAYHEAGHATAARLLGWKVTRITLDPPFTYMEMPRTRRRSQQLAVTLAGFMAEALHRDALDRTVVRNAAILDALERDEWRGWEGDDRAVCELLAGLKPEDAKRDLLSAHRTALGWLREHWREVEAQARELLALAPQKGSQRPPRRSQKPQQQARLVVLMIAGAVALVLILAALDGNDGGIGNRGGQRLRASLAQVLASASQAGVSTSDLCAPGSVPVTARQVYPGTFEVRCSDGTWSGALP